MIEQRVRFRDDVEVAWSDGAGTVSTADYRATLRGHEMRERIDRLQGDPVTEDELLDGVPDPASAARLLHFLATFERAGLLQRTVADDDCELATLVPMGRDIVVPTLERERTYRLSRFVWVHQEENQANHGALVLDSPLAAARVLLQHPRATALLSSLSRGTRLDALDDPAAPSIIALFAAAGALDVETHAQRSWEAHDLLFHARSRMGRHNHPYGGTYRFTEEFPSPPVIKPPMSTEVIDLPTVDATKIAEPPLLEVMEKRQSIRAHGKRPIRLDEVGAFLYRTARLRARIDTELGDLSTRPYPGGGAIYELEIYLTVDRCDGLAPGFYHYAPEAHQLEKLDVPHEVREKLLTGARASTLQETNPQILITLASRFGRMTWKYQSMAYAATLKNVGVLMHGMYLVAEAMQLAPCALGGGDSDLFSRASGTDYYEESSVGEFMLGTRP